MLQIHFLPCLKMSIESDQVDVAIVYRTVTTQRAVRMRARKDLNTPSWSRFVQAGGQGEGVKGEKDNSVAQSERVLL